MAVLEQNDYTGKDVVTPNMIFRNMRGKYIKKLYVGYDATTQQQISQETELDDGFVPYVSSRCSKTFMNYLDSRVFAFVQFSNVYAMIVQRTERTWVCYELFKNWYVDSWTARSHYDVLQGWARFKEIAQHLKAGEGSCVFMKLPTDEEFDRFQGEINLKKL